MIDDSEALHQRRKYMGQYNLDKVNEIKTNKHERQNRIPFRLAFAQDGMKYMFSHPRGAFVSCLIIGLIVMNLNQGPDLDEYFPSQKILSSAHGPLRTLETSIGGKGCKKTPFVSPHDAAYSMPSTLPWYSTQLPSHIDLCQELIKRNDYVANHQQEEGEPQVSPFTTFTVNESPQVCTDWSKPHSAVMQLISSSIVATVGERFGLEYKHNCRTVLESDYLHNLQFDVSTVQMIFPELKMPIDQKIMPLGTVVHDLCKSCIQEYNENSDKYGSVDATHHCLAFPNRGEVFMQVVNEQITGRNAMPEMIEVEEIIDSDGHIFHTALESVLPLVRNRLWHQARDWQVEALIPSHDPKTGVVIFVDAGSSMPIPFHLYKEYIPQHATRVDILSGPHCATGKLSPLINNQPMSCLEYVSELRDYLLNYFNDLGVEVRLELVSSTATSYTRMIQTNTLICPPETYSCLLPALAKEVIKNAVIFESPNSSTYNWFVYLTHAIVNTKVIRLTHDAMAMDRDQQLIERKYADFSVGQVVGPKPEVKKPVVNTVAKVEPQLNPVVDNLFSTKTEEDVYELRADTSELFEPKAYETNVQTYLQGSRASVKNFDTTETRSNEEPAQTSEGEVNMKNYRSIGGNEEAKPLNEEPIQKENKELFETDVNFDPKTLFEENETNDLFNTQEESITAGRSYDSTKMNNKEEESETDVDINYNNLFENWR